MIGTLFIIGALRNKLYSEGLPGPGLLPFLAGTVLVSLGIVVLISAIKESAEEPRRGSFFPQADSWKRVGIAVLALFGYVLVWEYLGFLLTTFLFVVLLLRFVEPQKWGYAVLVALLVAISFYVSFQLLLKAQFPKGVFRL